MFSHDQIEVSDPTSTAASDASDESGTEDAMTSVPPSRDRQTNSSDHFSLDLGDFDDMGSSSKSSFPSIHFERSVSPKTDEDEDSNDDAFCNLFGPDVSLDNRPVTPPALARTLYIQMVGIPSFCVYA